MRRTKSITSLAKRETPRLRTKGPSLISGRLIKDLRSYIEQSRQRAAAAVNIELVTLYWQIGDRIRRDLLQEKRAGYGQQIVHAVSAQLSGLYGDGFSQRNLFNMIRFAEVFPDPTIVHALSAQLSWTHFREIIYLDDPLQREFYAELCRVERWSTRTLHLKIQSMLFERTALSKKPDQVIRRELKALRKKDLMTPDLVFRDPYLLSFAGLREAYSEKDLEAVILRELESFILELGVGFAFVARQKHIPVDGTDYYLDLLFYHRGLRRLVAIELKLGKFQAKDKGQMELYLRWLAKHEQADGEEAPLGLILCADKTAEHVELLELEKSGIRVAQYLLDLPPRKILEHKLRQAIAAARHRLAASGPSASASEKGTPPKKMKPPRAALVKLEQKAPAEGTGAVKRSRSARKRTKK